MSSRLADVYPLHPFPLLTSSHVFVNDCNTASQTGASDGTAISHFCVPELSNNEILHYSFRNSPSASGHFLHQLVKRSQVCSLLVAVLLAYSRTWRHGFSCSHWIDEHVCVVDRFPSQPLSNNIAGPGKKMVSIRPVGNFGVVNKGAQKCQMIATVRQLPRIQKSKSIVKAPTYPWPAAAGNDGSCSAHHNSTIENVGTH